MPRRRREQPGRRRPHAADIFAALGDETRLALLDRLSGGASLSIAQLARGATITRQAITKHLRVLGEAGLVRGARRGRETRFQLQRDALIEARRRLDEVSLRWDEALERLRAHVES